MFKKENSVLYRIIIVVFLFGISLLSPLSQNVNLSFLTMTYSDLVKIVCFLIMGYDVIIRGVKGLFGGGFLDENFLMTISSCGAIYLKDYGEAVAVMLLYQIGEMFQSYALGKSRKSVKELTALRPTFARIKFDDGTTEEVKPQKVAVGSIILVKPGERVPIDGIALGGSVLDTSALTGEAEPLTIKEGEEILSGFVNLTDSLLIKTTKTYSNSSVARILELSLEALDKKSKTEKFITKFAKVYTPSVVVAAVLLAIIPPFFFGKSFNVWFEIAISFLAVSCPCALVISVPLSFFGGIGRASKNGILIKGGTYLEALANLKTIVTDKTGTLTNGFFSLVSLNPANGVSEEELLELAAYGEANSNHPLAVSVKNAYTKLAKKEIDFSAITSTEEIAGMGIKANVFGSEILIGSQRLLNENGTEVVSSNTHHTVIYVSKDKKYMGELIIADEIKKDAKEALKALKSEGVSKIIALTGDNAQKAEAVKIQLDLDEIHSELLPKDKLTHLEEIIQKENRSICFIGDGINDAPALSRADVGIAMGALGSDAAIEAADVVIMDDKISSVVTAVKIAKKTKTIVKENIFFTIGAKLLVLLLITMQIATLKHAVFADVGVAMLATLNAMRLLYKPKSK